MKNKRNLKTKTMDNSNIVDRLSDHLNSQGISLSEFPKGVFNAIVGFLGENADKIPQKGKKKPYDEEKSKELIRQEAEAEGKEGFYWVTFICKDIQGAIAISVENAFMPSFESTQECIKGMLERKYGEDKVKANPIILDMKPLREIDYRGLTGYYDKK